MKSYKQRILELQRRGFTAVKANGGFIRVSCDCCEALVINGHATHERGCPNDTHECTGCWEIIPANVRYCQDCR